MWDRTLCRQGTATEYSLPGQFSGGARGSGCRSPSLRVGDELLACSKRCSEETALAHTHQDPPARPARPEKESTNRKRCAPRGSSASRAPGRGQAARGARSSSTSGALSSSGASGVRCGRGLGEWAKKRRRALRGTRKIGDASVRQRRALRRQASLLSSTGRRAGGAGQA